MKRFIQVLSVSFAVIFSVSQTASALGAFSAVCSPDNGQANTSSVCEDVANRSDTATSNPITGSGGIIMKAINLLAFLTGVSSIIIIIIGGIKYVLSTGDPSRVSSAKDTILYAVIGLVISVTARGIVLFLVNRLK